MTSAPQSSRAAEENLRAARRLLDNQPLTVLIAALGGQGGGVLTDWIAHAARARGMTVQATSTPGVSQRTGATTYYLEIAATPLAGVAPPVLGLVPVPGRVDVLVCSELIEAARMLERGMCTPGRTTLVASTHRVYTTREKITGGDGRFDAGRVLAAAQALSRHAVLFDMEALRQRHRAAISAAMFGGLAGSAALNLGREDCEAAIRAGGVGVAESLAAFAEAWEIAAANAAEPAQAAVEPEPPVLPAGLANRIDAWAPPVAEFARWGAAQVGAYQNLAYATRYVDRVERVAAAEADPQHPVAREVARCLALWMCYEDLIHVASAKARASRLARIRQEAGAGPADVVRVYDFFKPRAAELAAILPYRLGLWLERNLPADSGGSKKGVTLQSSSVVGAAALRLAAALRPLRPRSLRFAREQAAIDDWLAMVEFALAEPDIEAASALARLPRELKGYGDTHDAGRAKFQHAVDELLGNGRPRHVIWRGQD